jgi:cell division protease FtsH|mmetsp:Transcript_80095/g.133793  ORF Transcript_80095/g.133793 Transcript_80095/m.133793 type:complete len:637 (+) Transcript_80095:399-2309(+)
MRLGILRKVYILKDSPALAVEVNIAGSESRYRYVKAPKGAPLGDANVKRLLRSYNIPYMEGISGERVWVYSYFLKAVDKGWVKVAQFSKDGNEITLMTIARTFHKVQVPNDPGLISKLQKRDVVINVESGPGLFGVFARTALEFLFWLILLRAIGGRLFNIFGQKSARQHTPNTNTGVKFEDVAGVDDAKLELQELVDFLKNPGKYTALGAKIPKGSLLIGPPGTGKTLLAKAVAGEAGVPFFSCSASEFVEVFAGMGASRVRDLFALAKKKAPCIIFIDEIDAVGRERDGVGGGQNQEREQTINQLLTEMDGFVENSGVIVLAATNRVDILDPALLRPGRFDRQVSVDPPDVGGREAILKVHSRNRPLTEDVDLRVVARRTPGFTGADLQNLLNEAAIMAGRRQQEQISPAEMEAALERVQVGAEKTNAVTSAARQKLVAYHEAGHALVGALMPNHDPVAKITIIPRGKAGGLTFFTPSEDRLDFGMYTRSYLEEKMAVAFGGRVAEELIFGRSEVTTGASSDFEEATKIATYMVVSQGFSDEIGPMVVNTNKYQTVAGMPPVSEATAKIVDDEVQKLVREAYDRAKTVLTENMDSLNKIAERLIEKETMEGAEVLKILNGDDEVKDEDEDEEDS